MESKRYYGICVDDELAILNQLDIQLSDHFGGSCEFEFAQSAEEALELYHALIQRGEQIWLVMSDQLLPGMSGDDLLASIHEEDHRVIKVLLTGRLGLSPTVRAINHAGLNYYIEKPWSQNDLFLILDKLKFQYEMTTLLNEMNLLFASSIDLNETLKTVFYNIVNVIRAEAGSIFLVEKSGDSLACKLCQGPKNILGMRVPIGAGIVGHVAKTRQIDVTTDVQRDERHYDQIDAQSGFVTKSMVSVPLISKGDVLGVIQVINKKSGQHFSKDDVNLLQALSSGGALAIQNAVYAQQLIQEERIRSELLIAHQIQQGILPDEFPGHPAIHFEAFSSPAKMVGGDFYDYFQLDSDRFAFVIGDVCGKGVPAAIFMASCRSIIKANALSDFNPTKVMPLANKLIAEDAQSHGLYVTALYGVYHVPDRRLQYINAGHTLTLLFRTSTASCSSLCNRNLPLGMFEDAVFDAAAVDLEPGDILVLYTDGINEAENLEGDAFGVDKLVEVILEHGPGSTKDLCNVIVERVESFSQGREQRDDITLMIVQV